MTHFTLNRTFHPVGQGAFFTERFTSENDSFNVVYDCGTNSCMAGLINEITQTFAHGVLVDVVFVSHLDKDHINGIQFLAKNGNLTNRTLFVMPLFSKEVFILSYLKYGASFIQLFRAISRIGCHILFVKQSDNDLDQQEDPSMDIRENRVEIESKVIVSISGIPIKGTPIQSGTRLKWSYIWEYVPFNPSGANADLFQKELAKQRIQLDLVLNALGKTRKSKDERNELSKVRKIYEKVTTRVGKDSNKLNISSLVMLSHKASNATQIRSWPSPCAFSPCAPCPCCWDYRKSACLYTGDTDLSTPLIYQQLMNDVMRYQGDEELQFLQIPHHGSKNNYCMALCRDSKYDIAFTNYGVNYHQKIFDSQLIMNYLKQGRPLVLITEYLQTRFEIHIHIR